MVLLFLQPNLMILNERMFKIEAEQSSSTAASFRSVADAGSLRF